MAEKFPSELIELGRRIRHARDEKHLSIQALADKVNLASQQLRRIEKGEADITAIILARITSALEISCDRFLDHVPSIEQRANELWKKHGMEKRLAGSKAADFKAKRAILQSMGLWDEE